MAVMGALLASWLLASPTAVNADDVRRIALGHVREQHAALGLEPSDVADVVVTSDAVSESSGVRHVYLRQRYHGIEIIGAELTVNIGRDGQVISVAGEFVPHVTAAVNRTRPSIDRKRAASAAARHVKAVGSRPREPVKLVYHRAERDRLRLAWIVEIEQVNPPHWWVVTIDAASGSVLNVYDRVQEGARR